MFPWFFLATLVPSIVHICGNSVNHCKQTHCGHGLPAPRILVDGKKVPAGKGSTMRSDSVMDGDLASSHLLHFIEPELSFYFMGHFRRGRHDGFD